MSKISMAMAENLANQLLAKKLVEVEKLKAELLTLVRAEYMTTIPDLVETFRKKHPGWIRTTKYLYLSGNGFNHNSFALTPYVPETMGSTTWQPNQATADKIIKKRTEAEVKENMYKTLHNETYNALMSLGTSKRVIEAFPELEKFFVPNETKAVVVNIQDLKKRISSDK